MRDQVYQWLMTNARGVFLALVIVLVTVVLSILAFSGLVLLTDGTFYVDVNGVKVELHRNIRK